MPLHSLLLLKNILSPSHLLHFLESQKNSSKDDDRENGSEQKQDWDSSSATA